jgi:hypothetical protein
LFNENHLGIHPLSHIFKNHLLLSSAPNSCWCPLLCTFNPLVTRNEISVLLVRLIVLVCWQWSSCQLVTSFSSKENLMRKFTNALFVEGLCNIQIEYRPSPYRLR